MIPLYTTVAVADNSGAKALRIIGIPGSNKKFIPIAGIASAIVRGAISTVNVKDHSGVRIVIVRVKKEFRRKDGTYLRFDDNAAVVVDKDKNMIGTRVFGPVARELKERGFK